MKPEITKNISTPAYPELNTLVWNNITSVAAKALKAWIDSNFAADAPDPASTLLRLCTAAAVLNESTNRKAYFTS
jgi:hypothetical protein